MSPAVFAALLAAAALHAGWNALIRRDPDRDTAAFAIAFACAVLGLAVLPFLEPMSPAAAPFAIASSLLQVVYYALVGRAYRLGELSVAYPIMRGAAPLIVVIVGIAFIEPVSLPVLVGIAIVGAGIVLLGFDGRRGGQGVLRTALLNAGVIAAYTIVDGLGARESGAPVTYVTWISIGGGLGTLALRLAVDGPAKVAAARGHIAPGLLGGAMSYASYGVAIWAMTLAPIGAVAAVRESSVLFAAALGALLLGEKFGLLRWLAGALVVAGLALVKLGG